MNRKSFFNIFLNRESKFVNRQKGFAIFPLVILVTALAGTLLGTIAVQRQTRTESKAAGPGKYEISEWEFSHVGDDRRSFNLRASIRRKPGRTAGNEDIVLWVRRTSSTNIANLSSWTNAASFTDFSGSRGESSTKSTPITVTQAFLEDSCPSAELEYRITINGARDGTQQTKELSLSGDCPGTEPTDVPPTDPAPTIEPECTDRSDCYDRNDCTEDICVSGSCAFPTIAACAEPTDEPAQDSACRTRNQGLDSNFDCPSAVSAPRPSINRFVYNQDTKTFTIRWDPAIDTDDFDHYRVLIMDRGTEGNSRSILVGWNPIEKVEGVRNTTYNFTLSSDQVRNLAGHRFRAYVRTIYKTGAQNSNGQNCVCRSPEDSSDGNQQPVIIPTQPPAPSGSAWLEGYVQWGGASSSTGTPVRNGKVRLRSGNGAPTQIDITVDANNNGFYTTQEVAQLAPCSGSNKCYIVHAEGYKNDNPDDPEDSARFGTLDDSLNITSGRNEKDLQVHDSTGECQYDCVADWPTCQAQGGQNVTYQRCLGSQICCDTSSGSTSPPCTSLADYQTILALAAPYCSNQTPQGIRCSSRSDRTTVERALSTLASCVQNNPSNPETACATELSRAQQALGACTIFSDTSCSNEISCSAVPPAQPSTTCMQAHCDSSNPNSRVYWLRAQNGVLVPGSPPYSEQTCSQEINDLSNYCGAVGFTCPSSDQVCSSVVDCPSSRQGLRGCSGDSWSVCCDSSAQPPPAATTGSLRVGLEYVSTAGSVSQCRTSMNASLTTPAQNYSCSGGINTCTISNVPAGSYTPGSLEGECHLVGTNPTATNLQSFTINPNAQTEVILKNYHDSNIPIRLAKVENKSADYQMTLIPILCRVRGISPDKCADQSEYPSSWLEPGGSAAPVTLNYTSIDSSENIIKSNDGDFPKYKIKCKIKYELISTGEIGYQDCRTEKTNIVPEVTGSNIVSIEWSGLGSGDAIIRIQSVQDRTDVNGDGAVNARDYDLVVRAYGQGAGGETQAAGLLPEDVNFDGVVNGVDLSLVISQIGTAAATQTQSAAPQSRGTGVKLLPTALPAKQD